jgi:hypothetical protein
MTDKKQEEPKSEDKKVTQIPGEISHKELPAEPTRYGDWEHNGRCTDF